MSDRFTSTPRNLKRCDYCGQEISCDMCLGLGTVSCSTHVVAEDLVPSSTVLCPVCRGSCVHPSHSCLLGHAFLYLKGDYCAFQ